ncbi:hypothetical protein [Clavibacter capsici]|uniref:hypothetical protein n=1 Tax=Clavibacter capsici TaxID=1874630 RepID=UPI00142838A6|nr:hypothetical protein [Clavibacter capsici]QIS38628.1 hypothetical protein GW572_04435 [Clavibacter capsici]
MDTDIRRGAASFVAADALGRLFNKALRGADDQLGANEDYQAVRWSLLEPREAQLLLLWLDAAEPPRLRGFNAEHPLFTKLRAIAEERS